MMLGSISSFITLIRHHNPTRRQRKTKHCIIMSQKKKALKFYKGYMSEVAVTFLQEEV